jgi:hypothetical protein
MGRNKKKVEDVAADIPPAEESPESSGASLEGADGAGAEKKTRERRTKAQIQADEARAMAVVAGPVAALPFLILSEFLGAHWKLTPDETVAVADPLALVMAKYSPALERYGPEMALACALFAVTLPRIQHKRAPAPEAGKVPG